MRVNKQNFRLFCFLLLMFGCTSCNKVKPPYLKINGPANGEIFNAPGTITVSVEMSDPDRLFGQQLVVTKDNALHDTILNFEDYDSPHEDLIMNVECEAATVYKIWVKAYGGDTTKSDSVFVSTY